MQKLFTRKYRYALLLSTESSSFGLANLVHLSLTCCKDEEKMAFAAALFAHEPVDVVLGSVVGCWHLENVGNAEQRLPRVPICYRLKQTNTLYNTNEEDNDYDIYDRRNSG